MSLQVKGLPEIPEETVRVARLAFPKGSLAMSGRDRLGEVFADGPFVEALGGSGPPGAWVAELAGDVLTGWPPGMRLIVRKERPHPGT